MKYLRGFLTFVRVYRVLAAIALGFVVLGFVFSCAALASVNAMLNDKFMEYLSSSGIKLTREQIIVSFVYAVAVIAATIPLICIVLSLCSEVIEKGTPFYESCVKKMRVLGIYYIALALFASILSLIFKLAFGLGFAIDIGDVFYGCIYIAASFIVDYGVGLQSDCLPLPSEKMFIESPLTEKTFSVAVPADEPESRVSKKEGDAPVRLAARKTNTENTQTCFFTFEDFIEPCEEVFITESANYSLKIEVNATGVASVKTTYASGEVISSFEGLSAGAVKIALPYVGEYKVQAVVTKGSGKVKVTLEKEAM